MKISRYKIAFKRWNEIASRDLSSDNRRVVNKIVAQALAGRSTLAIGPRGVGKKEILNDVVSSLEGYGKKTCRIDLDDPPSAGMTSDAIVELLEDIGFFRFSGEKFVVIDEARRLLDFRELSRILKKKEIVVIASASASVDSEKIYLDGFEVSEVYFPSFPEYIKKITDKTVDISRSRDYFEGYIRLEYQNDKQIRHDRAINEFSKTLNDIVFFNEVRDFRLLYDISVYLVTSPAKEISASSLKKYFSCSIDKMRAFLSHIEESGLVSLVRRIEDRERPAQASRICIPSDIAMSLELGASDDSRDLAMAAVYRELKKIWKRVYSLKIKNLIGFCSQEKTEKTGPVPIFSLFISYPYSFDRVYSEIRHAAARLSQSKITVLSADDEPHEETIKGCRFHVRPIWYWALMPQAEEIQTDIKVDNKKRPAPDDQGPESSGSTSSNDPMPSHLL